MFPENRYVSRYSKPLLHSVLTRKQQKNSCATVAKPLSLGQFSYLCNKGWDWVIAKAPSDPVVPDPTTRGKCRDSSVFGL